MLTFVFVQKPVCNNIASNNKNINHIVKGGDDGMYDKMIASINVNTKSTKATPPLPFIIKFTA